MRVRDCGGEAEGMAESDPDPETPGGTVLGAHLRGALVKELIRPELPRMAPGEVTVASDPSIAPTTRPPMTTPKLTLRSPPAISPTSTSCCTREGTPPLDKAADRPRAGPALWGWEWPGLRSQVHKEPPPPEAGMATQKSPKASGLSTEALGPPGVIGHLSNRP